MTPSCASRLRRWWQEFVGPETTAGTTVVTLALGVLGAALTPGPLARRRLGVGKAVALSGLAADLWGGAWVNNTRSCARWYERPGQTDIDHLRFAAAHLHPVAIAWIDAADRRPRWGWAAAHYGYLLATTATLRRFRAHRRWLGPTLTGGGVALDALLGPPSAARWFAPVFYVKLLFGHAAAARWSDAALVSCARDCTDAARLPHFVCAVSISRANSPWSAANRSGWTPCCAGPTCSACRC